MARARRQDPDQLERARHPRTGASPRARSTSPQFAAAADRALEFMRAQPVAPWPDGGGRLLATAKDGVAHLNAYLDDYAYLANALLEMLQLRWRNEDVALAARRSSTSCSRTSKTATLGRILLHLRRSRGADPSQQELQRRRHPGGQRHRGARAAPRRATCWAKRVTSKPPSARCAPRGWRMNRFPHGHMSLLEALDEYLAAAGDRDHPRARRRSAARWQRELDRLYAPHRLVFAIPGGPRRARRGPRRQEARRDDARLCVPRLDVLRARSSRCADLIRHAQARVVAAAALRRVSSLLAARATFSSRLRAASATATDLRAQLDQRSGVLDDVRRHLVIAHRTHRTIRRAA